MNLLQALYSVGLKFDRSLARAVHLPHPVISVGNVSVGGRAKTPLVIDLCLTLKAKGFTPVVLTRGYARKSKEDIWLLPELLNQLQTLSVDKSGDEAIEIYLRAQVPVLVSAQRSEQALKYSSQFKNSKTIFVLDDGFQHWKIKRDFDLVVVNERDFQDTLLPTGRLRESVAALTRADCVLKLEKDLKKKISIHNCEMLSSISCLAITTRAGSQKSYAQMLKDYLNFPLNVLALKDHLSAEDLSHKIYSLETSVKQLLLGFKEAVKLLTPQQLMEAKASPFMLRINERSFEVFLVELNLEYEREKIFTLLKEKGLLK